MAFETMFMTTCSMRSRSPMTSWDVVFAVEANFVVVVLLGV